MPSQNTLEILIHTKGITYINFLGEILFMKRSLLFLIFVIAHLEIAQGSSLSLGTYNIRNFDYDQRSNTPTNKDHLVKTIKNMDIDLAAIQEVNDTQEFSQMIERNFFGKYRSILTECGGSHKQRLGFIFNPNKLKLIEFYEDLRTAAPNQKIPNNTKNCHFGSRPLAIAKFKNLKSGKDLVAIAVHLKAGARPNDLKKRFKQLELLNDVVSTFQDLGLKNIIVMGDFNSTEYSLKGKHHERFKNSVRNMELIDTTAKLKCSSYWWGGQQDFKQYPSILDHILVSKSLLQNRTYTSESMGHCKALKCQVTFEDSMGVSFEEVSDHCPLVTELK